ncbi:MAG: hypothetical protein A2189_03435 [Paenibacillus sp. RIFOXYA1_FULL_44_5]|nr:MAG: hypothetical protein A2189_03435 [Paenibacillus sp. RIFOXYA1_FULL_44_5]
MPKKLALFYAIIGVILLSSIGVALSYENLTIAFVMAVVSILYIGSGFMIKARLLKKTPRP